MSQPPDLTKASTNDPDAGITNPQAPITRSEFLHAMDRMAGSFEEHLKSFYAMLLDADLKVWVQGGLLRDFCTGVLVAPVTTEMYEERQKHHMDLFWKVQAEAAKKAAVKG